MPGSVTRWRPLRLRNCLSKLYSGSGIHSLPELNPKLNSNLFQRIQKFKTPYGILTMLLPPYWQQEGGELHGFFASLIVTIMGGVICHYIIKWLDGDM